MSNKLHHFIVTGRHGFPMDLLSRESCWPASTVDAETIAETIADDHDCEAAHSVRLISIKAANESCWNRIHWEVSQQGLESTYAPPSSVATYDGSVYNIVEVVPVDSPDNNLCEHPHYLLENPLTRHRFWKCGSFIEFGDTRNGR